MARVANRVIKLRRTMTNKYGSYEAWCEHMRENARKGGKLGRNGGFGSTKVGKDGLTGKERAAVAGAFGGRISRRTKTLVLA